MYDVKRHESLGSKTTSSAGTIISLMQEFLDLANVLDVGCGHGHWLATFERLGASSIVGVDGSWTKAEDLLFPKSSFFAKNLGESFDLDRRFSLAISLEVAEHVDPRSSE